MFFRNQRDQIVPLPSDDLRWRRIVDARRRDRFSWLNPWMVAVSTAAAVAVAVTGGVLLHREPLETARSAAVTDRARVGQAPPPDFVITSVSRPPGGTTYALGDAVCSDSGARCPVVAAGSDGGRWQVRSVLIDRPAPLEATSADRTTVTTVTFVDAERGWAFGGALLGTTDGGRTWRPLDHPEGRVTDLSVTPSAPDPLALATLDLSSSRGEPVVRIRRSDLDGSRVTLDAVVPWSAKTPAPIGPRIVRRGDDIVVLPTLDGGSSGASGGVVDVQGRYRAIVPSKRVTGCASPTMWAASPTGRWLYARCALSAGAQPIDQVSLIVSGDGGRTWDFSGVPTPPAGRSVGASDGRQLVAALDDGLVLAAADSSGQLKVLRRTASGVTEVPGAPRSATGWQALRAEEDKLTAIPAVSGVFCESTDRGRTWRTIHVAGGSGSAVRR
ncbi:hypothetical protein QK900_15280 (plasmid) [Arsenicicoccus dermatophilus]|uniref:hypothetical protein n=1 Tax=Arsenicicoccus dermatophilus TaxID=1076331 RepID=UPI0038917026